MSAEDSRPLLLLVSTDMLLASARVAVLEQLGWQVLVSSSELAAMQSLFALPWSALMLCNTISESAQRRLAAAFRLHRPFARVLVVSDSDAPPNLSYTGLTSPVTPCELISALTRKPPGAVRSPLRRQQRA